MSGRIVRLVAMVSLAVGAGCAQHKEANDVGKLPAYLATSPCAQHGLDAAACNADTANDCQWYQFGACPAGASDCLDGACGVKDPCLAKTTAQDCAATAGCSWATMGLLCPLGADCSAPGYCHSVSTGGGCACASPVVCNGTNCPAVECDCSGAPTGGGSCTCACPTEPNAVGGATTPAPCDCDCTTGGGGGTGGGCVTGGTCACACAPCDPNMTTCPPCDCDCASGGVASSGSAGSGSSGSGSTGSGTTGGGTTTADAGTSSGGGSGSGGTSTCTCAPCPADGGACPPCNCSGGGTGGTGGGLPADGGTATDPCSAYTESAACLSNPSGACTWYAIGAPCQIGQTCVSGVCQTRPTGAGGGTGGGCVCACPACASIDGGGCGACTCDCGGGSASDGGACVPPPAPEPKQPPPSSP